MYQGFDANPTWVAGLLERTLADRHRPRSTASSGPCTTTATRRRRGQRSLRPHDRGRRQHVRAARHGDSRASSRRWRTAPRRHASTRSSERTRRERAADRTPVDAGRHVARDAARQRAVRRRRAAASAAGRRAPRRARRTASARSPRSSAAATRASPAEIIFDKGLGDLFVVRNAGQVISDSVLGSPRVRGRRARRAAHPRARPRRVRCGARRDRLAGARRRRRCRRTSRR